MSDNFTQISNLLQVSSRQGQLFACQVSLIELVLYQLIWNQRSQKQSILMCKINDKYC